jgi:hypothetical protein
MFGEAGAGAQQRIGLSGFLQHVQSSQGGDHMLLDLAVGPLVLSAKVSHKSHVIYGWIVRTTG